jgi:hypothetical protein
LAHALWALEQREAGAGPDALPVAELSATISAARHLPPPSHTRLFGIDQVLAQLLAYLEARDRHWLISLDGMAGLGKTALAREAAGRLAAGDRFAGIAWVTTSPGTFTTRDPQPMGLPALTCSQVLDAIARQLAGIGMGPLDLEAKHEHVRDLLRARSYLVVLDNLETAIDCRTLPNWFWDMANPSKFLLTSRHWLVPGAGASVIFLAQLSDAESLALIRHEAHLRGLAEVVSADDEVLRPILDVTGGNPLAIKLVVGQLLNLPLSHILTTLRTAQADTDPLYRFLYRVSWNLVSEPAQHLLLAMVRLPASGGNWDDLSAISGLSGNDLSSAIGEVTSHSLVQVSGFEEKTYCLHPLTYHFAHSKAAARKP